MFAMSCIVLMSVYIKIFILVLVETRKMSKRYINIWIDNPNETLYNNATDYLLKFENQSLKQIQDLFPKQHRLFNNVNLFVKDHPKNLFTDCFNNKSMNKQMEKLYDYLPPNFKLYHSLPPNFLLFATRF